MALQYKDITEFITGTVDVFATEVAKTGSFAFRLARSRIRDEMDHKFVPNSMTPHVYQTEKNEQLVNAIGVIELGTNL
tara:strand:+ start:486 stop:719 length:234 start_codon:yes stop_codon:yes gene_type:complete